MADPMQAESTADLLARIRTGDRSARNRLVERYLPVLTRLAHGRLPRSARSLLDTDDLVLMTLERALNHMETFEPRHQGALLAYLRRAMLNQIRDEIRRAARRPERADLDDDHPGSGPSPLEVLIGRETLERYDAALDSLPEAQHEAVVLRLEMGLSYREIADRTGSPSPEAVRMSIQRALARMAKEMASEGSR
jgi:RNA polymerase sigma-70 factor (ECF subfamily)